MLCYGMLCYVMYVCMYVCTYVCMYVYVCEKLCVKDGVCESDVSARQCRHSFCQRCNVICSACGITADLEWAE